MFRAAENLASCYNCCESRMGQIHAWWSTMEECGGGGGQCTINEVIIQMKNLGKKKEKRRVELLVTLTDIVWGSQ